MSTAEPGTRPVTFRAMFVEELRARREHAGLLQREFAEKAHVSVSSVKQYEAGKKKPGRKFATWCDEFYGCPGTFERLYDGMIAESYPSWFGPRVLFEDKASSVHEWEMRGIPGLLQTRSYADAVIRACRPYDTEEELDRDAAARIERQNGKPRRFRTAETVFSKPLPAMPGTRCGPPAEAGTRLPSEDASDCNAVRCIAQYHAWPFRGSDKLCDTRAPS
jgi:transcriptional regulator with XRE-family HTH domain